MAKQRFSQQFVSRAGWLIILYISTCHIGAGLLMMLSPDALNSIPYAVFKKTLSSRFHVVHGLILIVGAVLAVVALWVRAYYIPLIFVQQSILLVSAASCLTAIINGYYPGIEPQPRILIATDQLRMVVACIFHAIAFGIADTDARANGTHT
jgi:hypothetical protein